MSISVSDPSLNRLSFNAVDCNITNEFITFMGLGSSKSVIAEFLIHSVEEKVGHVAIE